MAFAHNECQGTTTSESSEGKPRKAEGEPLGAERVTRINTSLALPPFTRVSNSIFIHVCMEVRFMQCLVAPKAFTHSMREKLSHTVGVFAHH